MPPNPRRMRRLGLRQANLALREQSLYTSHGEVASRRMGAVLYHVNAHGCGKEGVGMLQERCTGTGWAAVRDLAPNREAGCR